MNMNQKLDLFLTFLRIGAFTFGGGLAMIPLIQREICTKRKWMEDEEILEIVAIAESTPGPVAVNTATFVGYRTAGFAGAFLATLGVVLPAFLIISLLSLVLQQFQELRAVRYAFVGIRAAVLALLLKALWSMFRMVKKGAFAYIIMAVSFLLTAILKLDAVFVLIGCAVFGLIWSAIHGKEQKHDTP